MTANKTTKKVKYNLGRSNLAVTVFVPYDCPNNCPFCTSKKDYADMSNFSLQKIILSLSAVSRLSYVKDIVITGGEPFADLRQLRLLLHFIKSSVPGKNVFINTTLPVKNKTERSDIITLVKQFKDVITGINVSRHICLKNKLEDDTMLPKLREYTKIRINSVLMDLNLEKKKIDEFIEKYAPLANEISFRADYTKVKTLDDLKGFNDPFLLELMNKPQLTYRNSGGCQVCNDDIFELKVHKYDINVNNIIKPFFVHYHRGMENSLVSINDGQLYLVNDIIIKQTGMIQLDWNNNNANVLELLKQWPKEKAPNGKENNFTAVMRDASAATVTVKKEKSAMGNGIFIHGGNEGLGGLDAFFNEIFGGMGGFGSFPTYGEDEDYDDDDDSPYGPLGPGCGGYGGGCGGSSNGY